MKIFKVFELRGNEVKEKLTQDDIDNIMDVFTGYVLDKYQMKEIHTIPRILGDYMDTSLGYYSCKISYNDDGLFIIDIAKSNEWSNREFNQIMGIVKKRLNSLGFISSGHGSNTGIQHWSERKVNNRYKIEIYKPMFAKRSRKK